MAGPITIAVLADVAKARNGINDVNGDLNGMGGKAGKVGKAIAVGFAAAGAAAVVVGKKLIDAGERAGTSNARIEQISKSMGLFGKETGAVSDRLIKLAESTARQTGVDQNAIKQTQAKLLTFKELAKSADTVGGSFDRATQAAVDLEAAGFGSAAENATQLGKALNDPVKGLTALNRSGITFTETEKKRIQTLVESNKVGQAQAMILSAIENQVGGTAAATANATDRMKVAFSQVMERVGLKLMPVLDKFATFLIDTLIPKASQLASFLAAKLGPAFSTAQRVVQRLSDALGGGGSGGLSAVITGVRETFAKVVAAVGPIVSDLVKLVRDNWSSIVKFTRDHFDRVRSTVSSALELIRTIIARVTQVVTALWNRFGDDILRIIKIAFQTIAGVVKGAVNVIQGVIRLFTSVLKGDWSGAWAAVKQIVSGAWTAITAIIRGAVGIVRTVVSAGFRLVVDAVRAGLGNAVDLVRSLPGKIRSGLGYLGSTLYDAGMDLIRGLINGVKAMASNLIRAASDVVGNAISAAKSKLGINSPSRVFAEIGKHVGQGMVSGLAGTRTDVRRAMAGLVDPAGLDVSLPAITAHRADPAATQADLLGQLIHAIQDLPREYRLNERLAYS